MPATGKRRALGQHFLRDRSVIDRIAQNAVEGAIAHGCSALLEIGPGKGAITFPLLERIGNAPSIERFLLSERDRAFAERWRAERARDSRLEVEEGDFMELPSERWLDRAPLAVVSNLPYSAGTAIATRLARYPGKIPVMTLMFQKEVAERLRAEPRTKDWGSLSVWIQNRWDVKKLCSVPPGAFSPPPEVDSEVVTLTARSTPRVDTSGDEDAWEKLLKTCFAHRRKMLRSGLPAGSPYRNALDAAGVDGTKRAEALNWEEWNRLYAALVRHTPTP